MKSIRYFLCLAFTIACSASVVVAQTNDDLDRDDWGVVEGDWNDDNNWIDGLTQDLGGVPRLDLGRWAQFTNGGTAILDSESDTGALNLVSGAVDIRQGGSLTVEATEFTDGVINIGSRGNLLLSGDGSFSATGLVNNGTIDLGGGGSYAVTGDLTNNGDLLLGGSGGSLASLAVGGDVTLAGTISPALSGQPGFGDNFPIITGANSTADAGVELVLPEGITVGRGLTFGLEFGSSDVNLVARNVPILTVNRATGAASMSNVVGDAMEVTGYSIFSDGGLLRTDGGGAGEGWNPASPSSTALAELNLDGSASLTVGGDSFSLGTPYNAAAGASPSEEDLRFEVALADGSVVAGQVEYEGPANNLILRVDPATGNAQIEHRSNFVGPFDMTGYSILSESGALKVADWTQLGDDWITANPTENAVAQFNPSNSLVLANGQELVLGALFDNTKAQDLMFEFTTVGGSQVFIGTVEYGIPEPPECPVGDIDGDCTVAFADFLILSGNFGMPGGPAEGDLDGDGQIAFGDFLLLSGNFGKSGAAAAAVPEPSSVSLIGMAGLFLFGRRRRRSRG